MNSFFFWSCLILVNSTQLFPCESIFSYLIEICTALALQVNKKYFTRGRQNINTPHNPTVCHFLVLYQPRLSYLFIVYTCEKYNMKFSIRAYRTTFFFPARVATQQLINQHNDCKKQTLKLIPISPNKRFYVGIWRRNRAKSIVSRVRTWCLAGAK